MNLEALTYIVRNEPDLIEGNVPARGNSDATLGVANFLIGNGGNVLALSANQRHHYESYIRPLVENVSCDGVFGSDPETGDDGCVGSGTISDDDLLDCYMLDEMLCQECKYVSNKMQED